MSFFPAPLLSKLMFEKGVSMLKKLFAVLVLALAMLIPAGLGFAQSRSSEAYGSGVHQYFSGRHQDAIASLNKAIAKDAKNSRAYYFRGLAKMGSGDTYGAESDFEMGALVESASSKRRTSVVTRSLERVQGSMRMKLEKTRRRVFAADSSIGSGSRTAIASSIPLQSFPTATIYHSEILPVQTSDLVTYDAPVLPPPAIVSTPIASTPIVSSPTIYQQPQVSYSQPIVEQQIFHQIESEILIQPQTVVHSGFENVANGNVIQGFADPVADSYSSPIVFIEPAPGATVFAEDDSVVGTPSDETVDAAVTAEPDMTPGPDQDAGGPFGDSVEADLEVGEAMAAADEAFPVEEVDESFPVEEAAKEIPAESAFGSIEEPSPESAGESPFDAEFSSEPANVPEKNMAAQAESVEQFPAAASEEVDAFGDGGAFGNGADDSAAASESPFGADASAEPSNSSDGSDPFGAGASEATEEPFGAGDPPAESEEPFGAGDPLEDPEDPFGDSAPEEFTDDPFGS